MQSFCWNWIKKKNKGKLWQPQNPSTREFWKRKATWTTLEPEKIHILGFRQMITCKTSLRLQEGIIQTADKMVSHKKYPYLMSIFNITQTLPLSLCKNSYTTAWMKSCQDFNVRNSFILYTCVGSCKNNFLEFTVKMWMEIGLNGTHMEQGFSKLQLI